MVTAGCSRHLSENFESMTYDQCKHSEYCSVAGIVSIKEVDHVKMARLELADGKCVNISLPRSHIKKLERSQEVYRGYYGQVFPGSRDSTFVSLKVNGRKIGVSQCGNFYVFVK